MKQVQRNRTFFTSGSSSIRSIRLTRTAVPALLLVILLLLSACDFASMAGLPAVPTRPAAAPTVAASNPTAPSGAPTVEAPLPIETEIPGDAPTPGQASSSPTAAPPAADSTPSNAPSAVQDAIKSVIQKGNQEEEQAFASGDPSVMADTSTSDYYQQMVQSYNDMANQGITGVKLLNLTWGTITLQDSNNAQANTTETWLTTLADGSTLQETDANVYTLVLQGGAWKVKDDQHPSTRPLQPLPGSTGTPGVASNPSAPSPVASVPPAGTSAEQSSNWAGYAATGGTFTVVSATWTIPSVSAGSGNNVASDATWVGIGGADTTDLIQAGTQAVVQGGQVQYTAWWETLPQAAQTTPLDVSAGDVVSTSIAQQADGTWLIVIRDSTSGQLFQKSLTYQSSLTSAEWIEESPTAGRRTLVPLDDFGTVTFSNATTVEDGQQRTIAEAGGQPITMFSSTSQGRSGRFGRQGRQAGQPLAQPSALGADGASFSVTRTNAPAPSTVP